MRMRIRIRIIIRIRIGIRIGIRTRTRTRTRIRIRLETIRGPGCYQKTKLDELFQIKHTQKRKPYVPITCDLEVNLSHNILSLPIV
jgi:hypothetical protein